MGACSVQLQHETRGDGGCEAHWVADSSMGPTGLMSCVGLLSLVGAPRTMAEKSIFW